MKNSKTPTPFISVKELAPLLGVHGSTIRRWCRAGSFPKPFASGNLRWVRRDLEAAGLLTDSQHPILDSKPSQN